MQLLARDEQGRILFVEEAFHSRDYFCPECSQPVRVREGPHRRRHFYHKSKSACRQSRKSEEHLAAQTELLSLLPKGEAQLERHFPEIGRIADVAWEQERLVFEVQCSTISLEEVQGRNRDYRSVGYEVIWILHTKRYLRRRMCSAEAHLSATLCYYTNMDGRGRGSFFDQVTLLQGGLVLRRLPPLRVFFHRPKRITEERLPPILARRPLCFEGDALDRFVQKAHPDFSDALAALREDSQEQRALRKSPLHYLNCFYRSFFRLILEHLTRD